MNPATKSMSMSERKARQIAGDEAVDKVLSLNCDFTNRVIDDVYGVYELSASVKFIHPGDDEEATLTVLYLVGKHECDATDDLSTLDWSDYTFVID
jgi:hypothetical protein